jgi:hypothetical protein
VHIRHLHVESGRCYLFNTLQKWKPEAITMIAPMFSIDFIAVANAFETFAPDIRRLKLGSRSEMQEFAPLIPIQERQQPPSSAGRGEHWFRRIVVGNGGTGDNERRRV